MFVYNSNRVNAVIWAATIRWLLDWMEQLTNAVSGCHAVARFRFFLLFYSFYIHTNEIARTRITGCLLHVRLCCSLCKHSFWNARGNENIDAITFAICAAKESTRPPQFINLFRTQTPFGAWKSEREWNERRGENPYWVCRFCSFGLACRSFDARCQSWLMRLCICVKCTLFTVREAKSIDLCVCWTQTKKYCRLVDATRINHLFDKCAKAHTHTHRLGGTSTQPAVHMPRASSSVVISADGLFPLFADCVFLARMTDDDISQE